MSILHTILVTLALSMISKNVSGQWRATMFGIVEAVDSVISVLFNFIFGYLHDDERGYQWSLLLISCVYWFASLCAL